MKKKKPAQILFKPKRPCSLSRVYLPVTDNYHYLDKLPGMVLHIW